MAHLTPSCRNCHKCSAVNNERLGFNGIRQENLPPPFRRRLVPWDMKSEVTLRARFCVLALDELDDQVTRPDLDARNVGIDDLVDRQLKLPV